MDKSAHRGQKRWLLITVGFILLVGYCIYTIFRPLTVPGSLSKVVTEPNAKTTTQLVWPKNSQAAVSVLDSSILETHGSQEAVPTASVAKLITALTVLEKDPLKPGEQGPTVTLTAADANLYNNYSTQNGSVVKVQAGEKLTEYQMLQAIMLPSSNNIADSLAIWAFGSLKDYQVAANDFVERQNLQSTKVGTDASGLSPSTKSSAKDLVKLGQLTMKNPVLAEIVSQQEATNFPNEGTIKNVNFLLGTSGIVGIKTGNSDQAGGVFVGASKTIIDNKPVVIVSAVTGSQSLFSALKENLQLIQSAQKNIQPETYADAGVPVGGYKLPWGGSAIVVTSQTLTTRTWGGTQPSASLRLDAISSKAKQNKNVGSVSISHSGISPKKSAPVSLGAPIKQPTIWWRVTHP